MAPLPAVERSKFKNEIIDMLIHNESPRDIEKWLISKGEKYRISHVSLNNYKRNHIDVKGKAKKKLDERRKKEAARSKKNRIKDKVGKAADEEVEIEEKINNVVTDVTDAVDFLSGVVKTSKSFKDKLDINVKPDFKKETLLQVEKHKLNVVKAGIPAAKGVIEFHKDEPESPTFVINLDSKKERLKKIEDSYEYSGSGKDSTRSKSDS